MKTSKRAQSHRKDRRGIEKLVDNVLIPIKHTAMPLLKGGALAGALAFALQGPVGCDESGPSPAGELEVNIPVPGMESKADWAQYEGVRDTNMVRYSGSTWHEYTNCNTRGGCMGVDVFLKMLVKPVTTANLDEKRVGVVFLDPYTSEPRTATGAYNSTQSDGMEEWHVKLSRNSFDPAVVVFNSWYQDGLGHTYYDDNQGEFHVAVLHGDYSAIRQIWDYTEIHVSDAGVTGKISLQLADIDYDKEIAILWTVDKWQTMSEFTMGSPDSSNAWFWAKDLWTGYEQWQINLDIAQPVAADAVFEYALVFRHGVVNGAHEYEFWDNNSGNNYVVKRPE